MKNYTSNTIQSKINALKTPQIFHCYWVIYCTISEYYAKSSLDLQFISVVYLCAKVFCLQLFLLRNNICNFIFVLPFIIYLSKSFINVLYCWIYWWIIKNSYWKYTCNTCCILYFYNLFCNWSVLWLDWFLCIFTLAFLIFKAPAGGSNNARLLFTLT